MSRKHMLQTALDQELTLWGAKPYDELTQTLTESRVHYPLDFENRILRVEIVKAEETAEHIRLIVSVHSGGFGDFVPLSGELTVFRDGRVERRTKLFPS